LDRARRALAARDGSLLLPWEQAERARSTRMPPALSNAPRRSGQPLRPYLAALIAGRALSSAYDTGLIHLAAALGVAWLRFFTCKRAPAITRAMGQGLSPWFAAKHIAAVRSPKSCRVLTLARVAALQRPSEAAFKVLAQIDARCRSNRWRTTAGDRSNRNVAACSDGGRAADRLIGTSAGGVPLGFRSTARSG